MEYTLKVQCTDSTTGVTGCFIGEKGTYKAETPVLRDLAEFYPWMRQNGWKSDEYVNGVFHPWRVVRVV